MGMKSQAEVDYENECAPVVANIIDDRKEEIRRRQDGWKPMVASPKISRKGSKNQKEIKVESDESPRRRGRVDSDESPPRKRVDSDESPPRRGRVDSDESPPRRHRVDSDESPPRRNRVDSD